MAFEQSLARQPVSPSDSGRASPIPRKLRNQRGDDESPSKDKAYRRYASGVERALTVFDTNLQEWADYISFLGRLLKSLQARPSNLNSVPSKAIVAKRLAQCLNPSLPSGVHQKTLEVYNYIFTMIGKDALQQDLPLYLPGLSSTLSFASLSVRGPYLALMEAHMLQLGAATLRPALKAIILALLPGLEDETSEDFERTLKLVNGFKNAVRPEQTDGREAPGDEYFWQCFFLASITSNNRRPGALAYLVRHLPKLGQQLQRNSVPSKANGDEGDTALHAAVVTSPEPGLLLRCFAAGLTDDQLLIQRGFLDLLVTHLPLHSSVVQTLVKPEDLELLLMAAVSVVVRREMGLNRRLWNWLLGPEPSTHEIENIDTPASPTAETMSGAIRTKYFEDYGLKPLSNAILKTINENHLNPTDRARPFKICLSLMDRWEIGGLVVPEIFLPVVSSVKQFQSEASRKSDFHEVLKSASVFFDGVESGLIWGELVELINDAITDDHISTADRLEKLATVKFIINHFNVREEEMLMVHAPLAALVIMLSVNTVITTTEVVSTALNIAMDLVEMIPERAFQSRIPTDQESARQPEPDRPKLLKTVKAFYLHDQGSLEASKPPFPAHEITDTLLREVTLLISNDLAAEASSAISVKARLFVVLVDKIGRVDSLEASKLLSSIQKSLSQSAQIPFVIFSAAVHIITSLHSTSCISVEEISMVINPLVRQAWGCLSVSFPKYHVEAVRNLWLLQTTLSLSNREIEAALCTILTECDIGSTTMAGSDTGRRFGILWNHTLQDAAAPDRRGSKTSLQGNHNRLAGMNHYEVMLARPVFLMLDSLLDERSQLSVTVRTWLQSMIGIDRLFHLFVAKFSEFSFLQTKFAGEKYTFTEDDDLDQCVYYLRCLSSVLRCSTGFIWRALADNTLSTAKSQAVLYNITGRDFDISFQEFFVHICMRAISGRYVEAGSPESVNQLHRSALTALHQILAGPYALPLADLQLENELIDQLRQSIDDMDPLIQVSLLEVVFDALKVRNTAAENNPPPRPVHKRAPSQDLIARQLSTSVEDEPMKPIIPPPPPSLVNCLQAAFASPNTRTVLESWTTFLTQCLPFYSESIFQVLMPLVETFCSEIGRTFDCLKHTFQDADVAAESSAPESTLVYLLNGLEQVLARGHERLIRYETRTPAAKSPDQTQGFFGNMVSGVFASETPQSRGSTANNRLTVLLTFQDAIKIGFLIWSWGGQGPENAAVDSLSAASFNYTSLRMRNRARRLLEHLFEAETLECLETVVDIWQSSMKSGQKYSHSVVFNLLHVLDGSRPKHTIPAIFNAIYSRTNPGGLEPSRRSTLTSSLADNDLAIFLVEYTRSLEDDTMDEIWSDCMAFLRDILANPFPHRHILPSLLEFSAILGEKVDNTNFGEQRKMRRDLADIFLRLLAAIPTTRPIGFTESASSSSLAEKGDGAEPISVSALRRISRSEDIVEILATIAPNLPKILVDGDRVLAAVNNISSGVLGPTFRAKSFPDNINKNTVSLLYQVSRLPNTQKIWKKDLSDAFNDAKFFGSSVELVETDWLPLLRQWSLSDKERMNELISRMTPPSTAGIVFGVGATSARLDADRKTQLNLRRIATLILASGEDNFVTELPTIEEKVVELLAATTISSPSSITRGDIYMLLRALVLRTSPVHLAPMWPVINAELQAAIGSVVAPDHSPTSDMYSNFTVLQACKLLDLLICLAPDDFQLHEWLFITDSIDAVYKPSEDQSVGLVDELAEELGSATQLGSHVELGATVVSTSRASTRRPMIGNRHGISDDINLERKEELVGKVLRPFFSQLSIYAFESTYSMALADVSACFRDLLENLFDERTITKAL